MSYFFPVVFVVGTIVLYLVNRKDQNEDGSMTKKGWKKFWISLGIIFIAVVIFIGVAETG